VNYDDGDEDMEDFQVHPKKYVKKMKGTKVSFIVCNRNIIHISAIPYFLIHGKVEVH
jgi:hypothetical protein